MAAVLVTRTVERLAGPDAGWRQAADAAPADRHGALFDACPCLHAVECRSGISAVKPGARLRVIAWNAERLKYLEESTALLAALAPDILLLTELDRGMARSSNRDTVGELAAALGMGHVYAVEYVELGLGDARERAWHAGGTNREGLHGNAILSRLAIDAAGLVRLERDGTWFMGERNGERRIGGRNAAVARIGGITWVAVHLESHSDPAHRAGQVATLLRDVEALAAGGPLVIGGDFNTATVGHGLKAGLAAGRLLDPVPFEPLFDVMAGHGLAWEQANTLRVATQRSRPDGTPAPPFGRIDWLFARGLEVADPATIPAVDQKGRALSDHEVLALTVRAP